MTDHVIYDGNCNLCSTWVQILENLDQGQQFQYIPMQDEMALGQFQVTAADCEQGIILVDGNDPKRRWQGSDAAEEISKRLPGGEILVTVYRTLPGFKWIGDRVYEQIRDNRYQLFGKRSTTYQSQYPSCGCSGENY